MLNDITKRKINSLRQILVGKVPDPKSQVEQITNALIYKYMDDMDRQAEVFGGKPSFFVKEYERYAWRNLMSPKLGGLERMNLYMEALVKMGTNPSLSPIFRDILKNSYVPYRSPETLNLFLSEIDGFAYDHSEDLGDAFEYLLSIMGAQGDAGQFRTPRHIIDFIVEVVDPKKDDKILDPACGTAGFLISAYKHIQKNNQKENPGDTLTHDERQNLHKNFVGYDISPEMAKLSRVNMFLHNFPDPKIYEYDTLSSVERWADTFDVVIANPPFMSPKGGIIPHKKFRIPANRAEVLFTDYIVEHLKPKGRAGIIVPEGIIFQSSGAYKDLRKMLVEEGLYAVVSLPSGVFNPYSGVKTSVLLFDNTLAKQTKEVLFIKIANDGYDLGAQRRPINKNDLPEAVRILREWKASNTLSETNISVVAVQKEKIAESGEYNLSGDRYQTATDYTNAKWPIVELGEVCELHRGVVYSKKDEVSKDGYKILRANNISLDDTLFLDDIKLISKKLKLKESQKLIAGDIFICLASGSKAHVGKVAFMKEDTDFYFGGFMGTVRVKEETILTEYLFAMVRDQKFNDFLGQEISGANINNLSSSIIYRYKIPLPPLEVQKQIVAELDGYQNIITGAKQITKNWKPKIEIDPTWEKVKLGEVFKIESGGTPSSSDEKFWGGDIKWATLVDIPQTIEIINDTKRKITSEGLKNSSAKIFPKGTVMVSSRATIGRISISGSEMTTNQGFKNIIVDSKNESVFVAYLLSERVEQMEALASGGTFKEISKTHLSSLEIPLPPLSIQKEIVEKIEAERALVDSAKKLIDIYEQKTKDTLAKLWTE